MKALQESVGTLLQRLDEATTGLFLGVVAPRQAPRVAKALIGAREEARMTTLLELESSSSAPMVIVAGLPNERPPDWWRSEFPQLQAQLIRSAREQRVLLLLTAKELVELEQYGPQTCRTAQLTKRLRFVPDPTVDSVVARRSLASWYRERYGRAAVLGFGGGDSREASRSLGDVYIPARIAEPGTGASTSGSRDGRSQQQEAEDAPNGGLDLDAYLQQLTLQGVNSPVALLGHPGAGKTCFLRKLALALVEADRFGRIEKPLVLFGSLGGFARHAHGRHLDQYLIDQLLEAGLDAAHLVEHARLERQLVILLDGFDEVGDAGSRLVVRDEIERLQRRAEGSLIVVTSRIGGYDQAPLRGAHTLTLLPLTDTAVHDLLVNLCTVLDQSPSHTPTDRSVDAGRARGSALAAVVLGDPTYLRLARSPLLVTIIASIGRAEMSLPRHRVELYGLVTSVLVERWRSLRRPSAAAEAAAEPVGVPELVRLLGPAALQMVRMGETSLDFARLSELLDTELAHNPLPGTANGEEAIQLFHASLGLLVERLPGHFAFQHHFLAEYLAARELVRTGELERVVADRQTAAYSSEWHELILLAAGLIGVELGDATRLSALIGQLLARAQDRAFGPTPAVPALLAGLLIDNPGISDRDSQRIVRELIPRWWFEAHYAEGGIAVVIQQARATLLNCFGRPVVGEELRRGLTAYLGNGQPTVAKLAPGGPDALSEYLGLLTELAIDYGPALARCATEIANGRWDPRSFGLPVLDVRADGSDLVVRVAISRSVVELAIQDRRPFVIRGSVDADLTARLRPVEFERPLALARELGDHDAVRVVLEFTVGAPNSVRRYVSAFVDSTDWQGADLRMDAPGSPQISRDPTQPTFIGRYRVEQRLGSGAYGVTFRCLDENLNRHVAVKLFRPAETDTAVLLSARADYLNEARAAAGLSHPGIVTVHDFDRAGERPYIVMELLAGPTLSELLATGPLPPRRALALAEDLCWALAHAHREGVLHRDLKPANIGFSTAGPTGRIKLMDFGLATRLDQSVPSQPGRFTLLYASPESVLGQAVDERSDLYSLGAVLFEMITREPYINAGNPRYITIDQILYGPIRSVAGCGLPPQLVAELDGLLRRVLAKRPEDRPASAEDIARLLSPITAQTTDLPTETELEAGTRGDEPTV